MLERGFLRGNSKSNKGKTRGIIQLIYLVVAVALTLFVYIKTSSSTLIIATMVALIVGFLFILNMGKDRRRGR